VSVAAPVALLSGGAMLTVVAVQASAEGTVWILERASDGARASVTLSAQAAGGVSVVAGTVVLATAISTGWVLSAAGKAIAFIPNEVGRALLHNERVTR
jgi:biotin transporter BioY